MRFRRIDDALGNPPRLPSNREQGASEQWAREQWAVGSPVGKGALGFPLFPFGAHDTALGYPSHCGPRAQLNEQREA